jgi:hypothetical protein
VQRGKADEYARGWKAFLLASVLAVVPIAAFAAAESPAAVAPSWAQMLDRAKADPTIRAGCTALANSAREVLEKPIIRRPLRLEDVGQNRTWLDTRARFLEAEIRQQFAFAMADFAATRALADELPLLAAAYRLTGEAAFRDRIAAQLREMATWSPLQRPGWSLFAPGNRLPKGGKDGNWLATGCGVRAITECLSLMPPDWSDQSLTEKLRALLEQEIQSVVDDWARKRTWFIRSRNPISNQWVLPTEGLVEACPFLGVKEHQAAYDLGVTNLLLALDAHGDQGEFEEGFGYASFTVTAMLHAAQAMAAAGDRRAIDHPFLQNFPTWLVHHLQPGDMIINCFDAGPGCDAAQRMRPLMSLVLACENSPVANWTLAQQTGGPGSDLPGLIARGRMAAAASEAPALYAGYGRATRVNWRSSWGKDAAGVWVRGGHPLDQHDHADRGHVNLIWHGRPILIEAGTPDYGNSLMKTYFHSAVGHNVLQLGTEFPADPAHPDKTLPLPGWQKEKAIAPIAVRELTAQGGDVTVSCAKGYDDLAHWDRRVRWQADWMKVSDEVVLAGGKTNVISFRWHLGTEAKVSFTQRDRECEVAWSGAKIVLSADAPISVSQASLPDNTLCNHTGFDEPGNRHTCVTVQSREARPSLSLVTEIRPQD